VEILYAIRLQDNSNMIATVFQHAVTQLRYDTSVC